jgi:hypothetical protein
MASAWLIRRHIDAHARFGFVEKPRPSDVPFDMYTGDFTRAIVLLERRLATEAPPIR